MSNWRLTANSSIYKEVQNPQAARIRTRTDGSLSVRYMGYTTAAPAESITVGANNEETLEYEVALMMTCDWDESQESQEEDEDFVVLQQLMALQVEDKTESGPVWDDSDDEEMGDFIYSFAEGGGRDQKAKAAYAAEKMEYPLLKILISKTETAFSTADSSVTRISNEAIMGPIMYPPSTRQPPFQYNVPEIKARVDSLRGGYEKQQDGRFNLPSAQMGQGAILELPEDIGQYSDVIFRWKSITLNVINEKNWADNKAKMNFIENLFRRN